jgi:hypothetical protein
MRGDEPVGSDARESVSQSAEMWKPPSDWHLN